MKFQMLNSFTNFLEKSVNILRNLVAALPDLLDLNYISHSVVFEGERENLSVLTLLPKIDEFRNPLVQIDWFLGTLANKVLDFKYGCKLKQR